MADTGKAWPLIGGTGRIYGTWVITSISETQQVFFDDGTPRRYEFTISLKRIDDGRIDMLGSLIGSVGGILRGAPGGLLGAVLNQAGELLGQAAQKYRKLTAYPRPICKVVVNGNDITALLLGGQQPRLISIELTDNRGLEADQLDITLSDHDGLLAIRLGAPPCASGWAGMTPA
jgi:hypothetical protein